MTFDPAFLALMESTMTIQPLASMSTDGYGNPTFGTAVSNPCHLSFKQTLIKTAEGTEEIARATLWVNSSSTYSPLSKITVNGSTIGPVLGVDHFYDETGYHHSKVYFG